MADIKKEIFLTITPSPPPFKEWAIFMNFRSTNQNAANIEVHMNCASANLLLLINVGSSLVDTFGRAIV